MSKKLRCILGFHSWEYFPQKDWPIESASGFGPIVSMDKCRLCPKHRARIWANPQGILMSDGYLYKNRPVTHKDWWDLWNKEYGKYSYEVHQD